MSPFRIWQLLASLLLALIGTQEALAVCTVTGLKRINVEVPTRTINVPPSTPIGSVVYDETWRHTIHLNCRGTNNVLETYAPTSGSVYPAQGLIFNSAITIPGSEETSGGNGTIHTFPDGTFSKDVQISVRLQMKRSSNAKLATTAAPDVFANSEGANPMFNGMVVRPNVDTSFYFRLQSTINVFPTTCEFVNLSDVVLPSAPLSSFPGQTAGSVSTSPPKDFTISMRCTTVSGSRAIGVGFSAVYQHASRAPGVIAVDQGVEAARNIGLQIINSTTGNAIRFDTLERGPTPLAGDGVYNYPFRVRYYQTANGATTGKVTGRVEVRAMYQ